MSRKSFNNSTRKERLDALYDTMERLEQEEGCDCCISPSLADYNGLNLVMAELHRLSPATKSALAFKREVMDLVDGIRASLEQAEDQAGPSDFKKLLDSWESRCWHRKFDTDAEYQAHLETIDWCVTTLRSTLASQSLASARVSPQQIERLEELSKTIQGIEERREDRQQRLDNSGMVQTVQKALALRNQPTEGSLRELCERLAQLTAADAQHIKNLEERLL